MRTGTHISIIYSPTNVINICLQNQWIFNGIKTTFCNARINFGSFGRAVPEEHLNIPHSAKSMTPKEILI